ncbi:hypothetical protein SAMN04488583_1338 [Mycobacterium sp. 88mf]|nr:hypothetical protein SAMN04488583_1338 [Mycobacterium sp. 88mf]SFF21572.1 hypothetical protein SAMN04488582_101911 [Mycobacterium sp. 455mf]
MPTGPHVPSISYIRKALEEVPDAVRHSDPSTDARGSGADPAVVVWISNPDRADDALGTLDPGFEGGPDADTNSSEAVADEPAVGFEIPPKLTEADVRNALGDELTKIQQLSQLQALDAYGWYTTFHQKRYQYGVHIPSEGILAFALDAFEDLDLPLARKAQLAFHAILRHELFHFNVDCMIANWELATGAAVFWAAKERHRNEHGYVPLEEALANAYMLRGFKHPSQELAKSGGAYRALKQFCKLQPEGYRDAAQYLKSRGRYLHLNSFFDACCELSVAYRDAATPMWRPPEALDALLFYPDVVRVDWTRCPVIILDELGLLGALGINVGYFRTISGIEETTKFASALKKLDKSIQKRWQENKEKLAVSTSLNSLGFQQWKKDGTDYFSVRVGGNYRAHLRRDRSASKWFAEAIGNHKEMGHG